MPSRLFMQTRSRNIDKDLATVLQSNFSKRRRVFAGEYAGRGKVDLGGVEYDLQATPEGISVGDSLSVVNVGRPANAVFAVQGITPVTSGGTGSSGGTVVLADHTHSNAYGQGGALPLNYLQDVDLFTVPPVDQEMLVYDAASGLWVSGFTSLANLTDVDTTGLADLDGLVYDSGGGEWTPRPVAILDTLNFFGAAQFLQYTPSPNLFILDTNASEESAEAYLTLGSAPSGGIKDYWELGHDGGDFVLNSFVFGVGLSNSLRVKQTGHLLVGTTTDSAQLSVKTSAVATPGLYIEMATSSTANSLTIVQNGVTQLELNYFGFLTLGSNTQTGGIFLNGPLSTNKSLAFRSLNTLRWQIRCNNDTESGSDAGANLEFQRRSDAGALLGLALMLKRDTGHVLLNTTTDSAQLTIKTGGTGTVGIYLDTVASPTVNLMELRSDGTLRTSIGHQGIVLHDFGSYNHPASAYGFALQGTFAGSNNLPIGMQLDVTFSPSANIAGYTCFLGNTIADPGAGVNLGTGYGFIGRVTTGSGAGTLTTVIGVMAQAIYGTVKPTTARGFYALNMGSSGITTATGVHIAAQTGAATNYGLICETPKVGIGTLTPAASAAVDITSTTGALLLPRMTTTQRNALTAVNGMVIYNTTTSTIQAYKGGAWGDL